MHMDLCMCLRGVSSVDDLAGAVAGLAAAPAGPVPLDAEATLAFTAEADLHGHHFLPIVPSSRCCCRGRIPV